MIRPRWILSIRWLGRVWRWSDLPGEVLIEGELTPLLSGLLDLPQISSVTSTLRDAPSPPSASVSISWGQELISLIREGHSLSTATGEIAVLWPGEPWSEREVLVAGVVDGAEWGDRGEGIAFSIRGAELRPDRALWPPEDAVVSSDSWSTADQALSGEPYPWILGYPAEWATTGIHVVTTPGSERLLIAGHPLRGGDQVDLYDPDSGTILLAAPVLEETDGLGRSVSTVDISLSAPLISAETVYVRWLDGGLWWGGSRLAGAGQVCLWALSLASQGAVDYAAWRLALPWLDRYQIAGPWVERGSPVDWLRDAVLPLLAADTVSGPGGLGVAPLRTSPGPVEARVVEGPRWQRVSSYRVERETERVSRVVVSYAWSEDAPQATADTDLLAPGLAAAAHVALQRELVVDGELEEIEAEYVYDPSTAALIAQERLVLGQAQQVVQWAALHPDDWRIRVGSTIRIYSDSGSRLARVVGVTWQAGSVLYDVVDWR